MMSDEMPSRGDVGRWECLSCSPGAHACPSQSTRVSIPEHALRPLCRNQGDVQPGALSPGGYKGCAVLRSLVQTIWQSQSQDSLSGKAGGEGSGIFPSSWALIGSSLYHSEV